MDSVDVFYGIVCSLKYLRQFYEDVHNETMGTGTSRHCAKYFMYTYVFFSAMSTHRYVIQCFVNAIQVVKASAIK
jgi:hypothetical protein